MRVSGSRAHSARAPGLATISHKRKVQKPQSAAPEVLVLCALMDSIALSERIAARTFPKE
eukprot:3564852-Rhodomonas_salina.1